MSSLFTRHNLQRLAGALYLCLILGCAGPNPFWKRCESSNDSQHAGALSSYGDKPCESELSEENNGGCRLAEGQTATGSRAAAADFSRSSAEQAVLPARSSDNLLGLQITKAARQAHLAAYQEPEPVAGTSPLISEELPASVHLPARRTVTLDEAIDTALLQNPDAVIARGGGPVSGARRVVAATYPWNPSVQVEVDPYARDRAGDLLATKNHVSVMQTLELAHQRRYRRRAADAGWNREQAVIAQGELTAAVAAMRAYFDALYNKGLLDLARSRAKLQTTMVGVVDRRFAAGLATPSERVTASVAARQSQRQAELAEANYQTSLRALQLVLDVPLNTPIEPDSDLETYKWLPASEALEWASANGNNGVTNTSDDGALQWVSNRPDVVAANFAVSAANADLELAKADRVPNIATGPTYERDESGTLFFGIAAQMDIPVWNTGNPLVQQRAAELQQQVITWQQTKARAALQAQAAVNRYMIAHRLWEEHWAEQDASESELTTVTDAFKQGQASIVEVLTTQDNLIQERRDYLNLLHEISQAAADVIAALAIDPECLIHSPSIPAKAERIE